LLESIRFIMNLNIIISYLIVLDNISTPFRLYRLEIGSESDSNGKYVFITN